MPKLGEKRRKDRKSRRKKKGERRKKEERRKKKEERWGRVWVFSWGQGILSDQISGSILGIPML
jgi:hypothetical protein